MAKINHNNHLNTIDSLFTDAKDRGVLHLNSSAGLVAGRKIFIQGGEHLNFGSLGYLGLETDERLKEGAINYVEQYGTQSVMSRTYISTSIVNEMEETLETMFGFPTLVYSRASTAHISVIPTLVDRNDAIVLDQQAHFSIQTASQLMRQKGVTIEMVRHNNLEMLEKKIVELSATKEKIWYMADGVYSMFGDVAPMAELQALAEKYPKLWLYVDDCHGMSWTGKHGNGYVLNAAPMHERMILISTMAKGYGVHGGIAVFPNEELHRKVKVFGGPLSYSLPLSPADLGACMASAKIHLSDEIYQMQHELRERITYCNELLDASGLPVVSNPDTPIYFIGMGQPKVGYNMVSRLLQEGIYLNPSFFPMVPVKATGLRFGLTRNHEPEDLKTLVDAIAYHFPKALEEEGRTENQVRKAFRLPLQEEQETVAEPLASTALTVEHKTTIFDVEKYEWDTLLSGYGSFDWEGMRFMEDAFRHNPKPEENWDFHYFIVRDETNRPVVATFFTVGIHKDDFVSLPSISKQIEEKRKKDPYYLTSKTMMSGSMISVGQHMYVDRVAPNWQDAVKLLIEEVTKVQDKSGAKNMVFGEFLKEDKEIERVFLESGFFMIDMPNANIIENPTWSNTDEFLASLSRNNRSNIRKDVLRFEHCFETEIKQSLTEEEAAYAYKLFLEVKNRNYGLNFFDYPVSILEKMSAHPNWEFIVLRLKPEFDHRKDAKPVAIIWSYRSPMHYSPMIIGMDYQYLMTHNVYKQAMYQVVKRARTLDAQTIYLGFSADTEKRKYGAEQVAKVSFMQAKDNFNMEVIQSMSVMEMN